MSMRRGVVMALLGAAIVVAAVHGAWISQRFDAADSLPPMLPKPARSAAVGDAAPLIRLATLHGETVELGVPTGKPVFVYFWASWCAPCLQALPAFEAARPQFDAAGITLLSVAHDERRAAAEVLERIPVTFPVLVTEGAAVDPVIAFGSSGFVPFAVELDANGVIRSQHSGSVDIPSVIVRLAAFR